MQNDPLIDKRHKAAAAARALLEDRITWQDFMGEVPYKSGDSLIDDLVSEIEHEPKRGGFMGLTEKEWQKYRGGILDIIGELEKPEGVREIPEVAVKHTGKKAILSLLFCAFMISGGIFLINLISTPHNKLLEQLPVWLSVVISRTN